MTFDIDANGILHVSAKDKGTGKENKITIKANSGLSEAEIQKMVKDAELNAADDKKKLELVQARNQADAAIHSVKKSLGEYGDKLEAGEKDKIEAAIKDVEEAIKGDDKALIDEKTNTLMTASQKLGEKAGYQFELVLAMHAKKRGDTVERWLQTESDGRYEAGDRSGVLAPKEPADIGAIIAKIRASVSLPTATAADAA